MTRLIACALLASAACSSSMPTRSRELAAEDDRAYVAAQENRAVELEQTLSSLAIREQTPDCRRVCELVDEICELAQRICLISERHAGDPELAPRCAAAEQRCQRSRERITPACSCPQRYR